MHAGRCLGGARRALAVGLLVLACLPGLALAQLGYNEEDAKRIKSAEVLGALGDDLFGEQVNFYTGATSFRHTDLSIPGNHGLAVQIARSFSPEDPETAHNPVGKAFGDWELELPYIGGVFLQNVGWAVDTATPQNRCSSPTTVINLAPKGYNGFSPGMYWQGYDVVIPGQGANSLLLKFANDPNTPTSGGPWRWTTRDLVQISCLPSLQLNGGTGAGYTGEGFLAVTPDGTKYWFDQMVVSQAEEIGRRHYNPITRVTQTITEQRKEIRLYASRIEDVHGNWVTFTRSAGRLTQIASSDGRSLSLAYNAAGRISSVTDGVRSVAYTYLAGGQLGSVTYPDNSKWTFALATVAPQHYSSEPLDPLYGNWDPNSPECGWKRRLANDERVGTITHPSGATGTFTFRYQRHVRASVPESHCSYDMLLTPTGMPSSMGNPIEEDWKFQSWTPRTFDVIALKRKQISGPGLAPMQWDYAYGAPPVAQMDYGPHTRHVTVSKPDGSQLRLTFGNRYMINDGQLQKEEVIEGGQVLQNKTLGYVTNLAGQPFADEVGIDSRWSGDNLTSSRNRPLVQTDTVRQGVTFTSLVEQFDTRVRPVQNRRFSTLGYSRREVTTYHDHLGKWILGQVAQTWNDEEDQILSRTEFDPNTAAPLRFYGPGKASSPTATPSTAPQLLQTVTYRADGTVATLTDALGNTTQLNDWYRGIPRGIVFADGTSRAATLDSIGRVTSTTNEMAYPTSYAYDAGGRLAQITWPTGDVVAWAPTQISYAQVAATEYGLGPGHWRRTESRGNYRKLTYYDALWRPVVEQEHDTANIAGTQRFSRKAYDVAGRVSFEAYPGTTDALSTGVRSFYDALGRPTRTEQDSELGALVTQYAYLPDFVTRVTNPRGYATETRFQAFEAPATDSPVKIIAALGQPEQQTTDIVKNALGQTTALTRSGSYGGTPMALTRHYVYDARMRLCKRVEPETGAALFDYDAAGNVAWTAEGQALASLNCDRASVPTSERVVHSYDARNRISLVDYPDSTSDVSTTYFPDGLVQKVSSGNVETHYNYNKRRLLASESLRWDSIDWLVSHQYTPGGDYAQFRYWPTNQIVDYAPNALGQATRAGDFATNAKYHPNGALAEFTYGNGIVHTMTRNLRQLPERSLDLMGATPIIDDSYDYDANGNVAAISDGLAGGPGNRDMSYDALDRLAGVVAGTAQGGNCSFAYDPLDNLRVLDQGSRQFRYHYDADNRLAQIKSPTGALLHSFGHDARGNTTSKDSGTLTFDRENRLTHSALPTAASYVYDGLGRRVAEASPVSTYFYYSHEGKLLYSNDHKTQANTDHIYLSGSLVAARKVAFTGGAQVTYQHTDALGSPVAFTDAAGNVTRRERMTAWGEPADGSWSNEPGCTGHQMDAGSKLVYMQQRYYDPAIGRFLSVDPVEALSGGGPHFPRYHYANANPLRFTDPDGRVTDEPSRQPKDWRSLSARSLSPSTHLVSSAATSEGAAKPRSGSEPPNGIDTVSRQPRESETPRRAFIDTMQAKKEVGLKAAYGAGGAYRRDLDTGKDEVGIVPIGVGARGKAAVGGHAGGVDLVTVGYHWGVRDAPVDIELTAAINVFGLTLGFDPGTGVDLTLDASAGGGAFAGAVIYFDDTLVNE